MDKSIWQNTFEDSDLTKSYFGLCSVACDSGYTENHHIFPKSVWPEFEFCDWNLVRLSAADHYKAHEILPQICKCKTAKKRMLDAWWLMSHVKDVKIDADIYARLKEEYAEVAKARLKSPEVRAKLSAAKKGKRPNNADTPKSDETRKKMSDSRKGERHPFYGKSHSDETKAKISNTKTGVGLTEETKQRMRDSYASGKRKPKPPMTQATKDKLSMAHMGKVLSDETRNKMSHARKGKSMSDKNKESLRKVKIQQAKDDSEPVVCLETGDVFGSVRDAAEFVVSVNGAKIHNVITCISEICRGKIGSRGKVRKTAYGYHWRYLTTVDSSDTSD